VGLPDLVSAADAADVEAAAPLCRLRQEGAEQARVPAEHGDQPLKRHGFSFRGGQSRQPSGGRTVIRIPGSTSSVGARWPRQ